MGEDKSAIHIQHFDLVFKETDRSTRVKIPCVFIAHGAVFNLGTLPPIRSFQGIVLMEGDFDRGAKNELFRGEASSLFNFVQEGDNRKAVVSKKRRRSSEPAPLLSLLPDPF